MTPSLWRGARGGLPGPGLPGFQSTGIVGSRVEVPNTLQSQRSIYMPKSNIHCRILPLSRTNHRKLCFIVERLEHREVERMAHLSRKCLSNALCGRKILANHRRSIESVIDRYFERHPEELEMALPPEPSRPKPTPEVEEPDGLLTVVSHGTPAQKATLRAIIEAATTGLGMPVAFK